MNLTRRTLLGAAGAGVGAATLAACSGDSGSGPQQSNSAAQNKSSKDLGGKLSWGAWANPGEAKRFNEYAKYFEKEYKTKVTFQAVTGDYTAKLMTQLAGGTAPDVFYVGDGQMAKLVETSNIIDLTEYLKSSGSRLSIDDMYANLMNWCQPKNDGKYFGVTVDCNPATFWFNQDLLKSAGVSQDPAQLFEAGTWNIAALDEMLTKVKGTGKRGLIFESGWAWTLGWCTAFGGKPWADSGDFQLDKDDKSMKALEWLWKHMADGTITYGGSLPKGQGVDSQFYAGQLASCQYGRWILPNLKSAPFKFDIAPYPSEDGKSVPSTPVFTAAMSVNAKATNQDLGKAFTAIYCGKEGEKFRLSGGGNAVPACKGLEDIVAEAPLLPAHAKTFNDLAAKGYAIPPKIVNSAVVSANIGTVTDTWIKAKVSAADYAKKFTDYVNTGKAS